MADTPIPLASTSTYLHRCLAQKQSGAEAGGTPALPAWEILGGSRELPVDLAASPPRAISESRLEIAHPPSAHPPIRRPAGTLSLSEGFQSLASCRSISQPRRSRRHFEVTGATAEGVGTPASQRQGRSGWHSGLAAHPPSAHPPIRRPAGTLSLSEGFQSLASCRSISQPHRSRRHSEVTGATAEGVGTPASQRQGRSGWHSGLAAHPPSAHPPIRRPAGTLSLSEGFQSLASCRSISQPRRSRRHSEVTGARAEGVGTPASPAWKRPLDGCSGRGTARPFRH